MAKERIEVVFDTDTGRMMVGAQMETQAQKDHTVLILLSAIKLVVDYKKPVIEPASSMPGLNGKIPLKVSH